MSNDNTYQVLLQKLIAGTITPEEQWSLEKESLNDPFLADAIEGYYEQQATKHNLRPIKSKITGKAPTKRIRLRWPAIAASLTLLLLATFLININSSVDTSALKNKQQKPYSQSIPPAQPQNKKTTKAKPATNSKDNKGLSVTTKTKTAPSKNLSTSQTNPKETSQISSASKAKKVKTTIKDHSQKTVTPKDIPEQESDIKSRSEPNKTPTKVKQESTRIVKGKKKEIQQKTAQKSSQKSNVAKKEMALKEEGRRDDQSIESSKSYPSPSDSDVTDADIISANTPLKLDPIPLIKGAIKNNAGQPIIGVDILDTNENPIAKSDTKGYFYIPKDQSYIMTSFAGYDSLTVAVEDNLTIELKQSAKQLSQPHKRLIDIMDDVEVIRHYTENLNRIFGREWPLCKANRQDLGFGQNEVARVRHHLTVLVSVYGDTPLTEVQFFEDLPSNCEMKIRDIFTEAIANGVFEEGRPIEFRYRINL